MKKVLLCVFSLFCFCIIDENESASAIGNMMGIDSSDQEAIPITPPSVVMEEGETKQLKVPDTYTTYYSLIWTSSNEIVATVNETGLVTAVNEGTATITCTAKWESTYFLPPSGSCAITVKKKPQNIVFADAEVKRICVENWDADGDGELNLAEAATVTDLGEAFKDATSITSFNEFQYFTGLKSIGDFAFENCKNLSSLNIPENIVSIGMGAFLYCDLKSLFIPANVAKIGSYTLEHNKNLISLQVDAANTHFDSRNQCNAIIETNSNTLVQGCKTTIIPSDIKEIGAFAFEFVDLTHMELPPALEKIAWCAFYGCANLDEAIFPEGLKTIDRYAYDGCIGLKDIVIPASMEYVGGAAFAGCFNIETITVAPGSETYISPEGCNAIVSKDGSTLVVGCKNTVIPETVTTIGDESFRNQSRLTAIAIPDGVSTIEMSAFTECYALTKLDLPKSIESIGEYAFYGCRVSSVTIRRDTPIAITSNVFSNYANATLYVPRGSKGAYEAADHWKEFKEIVEMDDEPEPDDETEVTDISQMTNAIYIEPFTACIGGKVNIEVKVKNADNMTSYGFELVLPKGMSIAVDDDGAFDNALSLSSRNSEHEVMTNKLADDVYKIAVVSFSSESLTAHDGLVLTVKAHIDDEMTMGAYPVKVQNPLIVSNNFTKPSMQSTITTATIKDYVMGDVNGDGEVDLSDAIMVTYYALHEVPSNFNTEAADMNGDGEIDLSDAIIIIYRSLGVK